MFKKVVKRAAKAETIAIGTVGTANSSRSHYATTANFASKAFAIARLMRENIA